MDNGLRINCGILSTIITEGLVTVLCVVPVNKIYDLPLYFCKFPILACSFIPASLQPFCAQTGLTSFPPYKQKYSVQPVTCCQDFNVKGCPNLKLYRILKSKSTGKILLFQFIYSNFQFQIKHFYLSRIWKHARHSTYPMRRTQKPSI